jgi:hypothetical protein
VAEVPPLNDELSRLLDKHGHVAISRSLQPNGDIRQVVYLGSDPQFYYENIIDKQLLDLGPPEAFMAGETAGQLWMTDKAFDMQASEAV